MSQKRHSSMFLLLVLCTGCPEKGEQDQNKGTTSASKSLTIIAPPNPLRDLKRSEEIHQEIKSQVKSSLLKGLTSKDSVQLAAALTADFTGKLPRPSPADWVQNQDINYWVFDQKSDPSPQPTFDKQGYVKALTRMTSDWVLVERTKYSVFENKIAPSQLEAFQRAHFQIAGIDEQRIRHEIRGIIKGTLVKTDTIGWAFKSIDFDDLRWTKSAGSVFRDIGPMTGFGFNPSKETTKLIQETINQRRLFTVGGITVLDFNDDNYWDLLATYANRETRLFVNDGQGGFQPKNLPLLQAPGEVSKFFLWLDLDNDGREELIGSHSFLGASGKSEFGLYQFTDSGKMTKKAGALRFSRPDWMRRMSFESIVACDVNQDQKLDLIFTGYSHLDSKDHKNLLDARDGLRNLLFINQGKLKFKEESLKRGLTHTQYSFVAACHDFDKDGDPDILIGNDYGKNNYYENQGQGRFRHNTTHPFHLGASFSMGVSIADYDNVGEYAVSVSNMYSHAGHRILPLAENLTSKTEDFMLLVRGNSLYERVDGQWKDVAQEKSVDDAGWAWGNVFFDVDNDRDKDLFVMNGYTTHANPDLPDF